MNIKQILNTLMLMCTCTLVGVMICTYTLTGALPRLHQGEDIAPPEVSIVTLSEVHETLEELKLNDYEFGYNCFDFACDAMSLMSWRGQSTAIARIYFSTGSDHVLLDVPTSDMGWCFVEPQANIRVYPTIGGFYDGRKVIDIRDLQFNWVPNDAFRKNPIFNVEK